MAYIHNIPKCNPISTYTTKNEIHIYYFFDFFLCDGFDIIYMSYSALGVYKLKRQKVHVTYLLVHDKTLRYIFLM